MRISSKCRLQKYLHVLVTEFPPKVDMKPANMHTYILGFLHHLGTVKDNDKAA